MSGIATAIIGGVGLIASLGMGIHNKNKAERESRKMERLQKKEAQRLKMLENQRQDVIDKSDDIRAMKDEVFNPAANLGVAMQGVNLKMEETDASLANTLEAINQSGQGAGAATQLAQAVAKSKAQTAGIIEQQELSNQKAYLQGEQQVQQQKQAIESQAINEEINVYGRTETRELSAMNRAAGLADGYAQNALNLQQAADAAMMAGVTGAVDSGGTLGAGLVETQ
tara:strand:+ start:16511 stop:17188 length:678 start_codon:yes stop_codon:yes gene_type:complete